VPVSKPAAIHGNKDQVHITKLAGFKDGVTLHLVALVLKRGLMARYLPHVINFELKHSEVTCILVVPDRQVANGETGTFPYSRRQMFYVISKVDWYEVTSENIAGFEPDPNASYRLLNRTGEQQRNSAQSQDGLAEVLIASVRAGNNTTMNDR
jgi:hypothetical protein